MEPTVLAVVALLVIIFSILVGRQKKTTSPPPPGPPALPFIGNLHQLDTTAPHVHFWKLSKKYGPLMSLKLGSRRLLVVSSPRIGEEVLKTYDHIFCSRPALLAHHKISFGGSDMVFAPYGHEYRETRKISVIHLFSSKRVQSFRPIREDEVCRMIQKIARAASVSETVNLSNVVGTLTSTMICRVAFGRRYNEEDEARKKIFALTVDSQIVAAAFYFTDYFPLFGWLDKLTGSLARLDDVLRRLDIFYEELFEDHRDPNRPSSMDNDIIDILLKLREEKSTGIHLSIDRIKAVLMNVFIAGTDTSASAIVWAMTALMRSPATMAKVQAEIREVVGKKGLVGEDDCQRRPYLQAVIKETMRLYPPAPLLVPRETVGKCTIDGYEIQPKTLVYVNAWAIARDPEVWENPHEFIPERFLNSVIDRERCDFSVIPFGAGRRVCPGMLMGLATIEVALANLLYSFDWEVRPGMKREDIDTDVLPGIAVHKKNPLCLVPINCYA